MTTIPLQSLLLPTARSSLAPGVDMTFRLLTWMTVVLFILIVGAAFWFAYKYRRKPGDTDKLSSPTFHSTSLEVFWSVGPLLVCFGFFHWGVKQYMDARLAPAGAMEIRVRGYKWAWEFEYPNGRVETAEMHVPLGKPIKLIMTSKDVLHSFYVPGYRTKYDVIPGRYTTEWFEPTDVGEDQVLCTEYCGDSHSNMLARIIVETPEQFEEWMRKGDPCSDPNEPCPTETLVAIGENVYKKNACNTCHSIDGSALVGPSFKGVYGTPQPLADGSSVIADDNYIRESILVPTAKVVKGYNPVMPPYQGTLKDRQIEGVIEYLKTLK